MITLTPGVHARFDRQGQRFMATRRLPLLSCRPSKQRRIATYFGDDADRYGKQNEDIDGCAACDVIEVNGRHERYPLGPMPAARSYLRRSAFGLPSKQGASQLSWPQLR